MSAMAEMSRAIRLQVEAHAPTLQELDNETLRQFAQIVTAFSLDLQTEVVRRGLYGSELARSEGSTA